MFVGIYDIMHGYYHLGNLTSFLDLAAPLSNYTISYKLVQRIGYWDTCADAIGEDFHTFQKAFWKTNGEVKAKIILAPFNQANIETGKGYWENIKARFWQGERHSQGCADIGYSMKQLSQNPKMWKGCAIIFLLPFMICDFIFAGGDSKCLTQEITKYAITINLKQWLLTDAWVALALIIILLVILVVSCISLTAGAILSLGLICIIILIGLYKIAWLIIGSVMFWG